MQQRLQETHIPVEMSGELAVFMRRDAHIVSLLAPERRLQAKLDQLSRAIQRLFIARHLVTLHECLDRARMLKLDSALLSL